MILKLRWSAFSELTVTSLENVPPYQWFHRCQVSHDRHMFENSSGVLSAPDT